MSYLCVLIIDALIPGSVGLQVWRFTGDLEVILIHQVYYTAESTGSTSYSLHLYSYILVSARNSIHSISIANTQ